MSPEKLMVPQVAITGALGAATDSIVAMADAMVNQQAAMIAYIDDFYLMAWVTVAVAPLVLLLKKPKGKMAAVVAE